MREPPPQLPGPSADAFTATVDAGAKLVLEDNLSCHARDGFDLSGDAAFVWGLTFRVKSAAECCQACARHQALCGKGEESKGKAYWHDGRRCSGRRAKTCNAWVFCGGPRCFSYDVHNHSFGECALRLSPEEPRGDALADTPAHVAVWPRRLAQARAQRAWSDCSGSDLATRDAHGT
eukprot:4813765-Prymnesium_polylepis.2